MVRLLRLSRGESDESPREITTSRTPLTSESGENGWLIRFFDSAFFCEWIAVSYLYKHDHAGVRDYLCNRMYTLPLSGIESYLFQICYMMVHKPSPSLDKFVIDMCSKSLKMAMKVHWFLLAELEDSDDNEGINRIQEKCQIAATLMGEWPPLVRPPNAGSSPGSKNQVLNRFLSSKQLFLSLTTPSPQRSISLSSPSSGNHLQEDGNQLLSPEENKIFKKFIPSPKVRDALLFRKSAEKDEEENEKDGFFKRILRDSKGREDEELTSSSDGFFKRLLKDSKGEEEEMTSSSEGFFKKLFRDSKSDSDDKMVSKPAEDDEKEGFFKKLFKDKFEDKKDVNDRIDDVHMMSTAEKASKSGEDDEKEGFFRKLFKDKSEENKDGNDKNDDVADRTDDVHMVNSAEKTSKSGEYDEKEGFFRKLFKDKTEEKKEGNDKNDDGEEEDPSEFSLLRRLFRVHPGENKTSTANEYGNSDSLFESSPGTENFFRKLFRDRDRSIEDSELFNSKMHKEKHPGSPKQQIDRSNSKPPLPNNSVSQLRKGAYHDSLDFVLSLCDTSYGLVDVFPIEDRKTALHESLAEINSHLAEAQNNGGVCFPMGKGMYRVVHIPEDEAVLLNSREKAPYLICVEVLKFELPSSTKDASNTQKLFRGGIPLANGDALLQKPPPWAYPLWTAQEAYRNSSDRMSSSTAQAIDQAMTHKSDAKVKFVNVCFSVEKQSINTSGSIDARDPKCGVNRCNLSAVSVQGGRDLTQKIEDAHASDMEWVRVVLTGDPGLRMEDIEGQGRQRRKEHRRVPSTVAIEEVKAAAAKGEAPPGLPLKGAGQDSSDAQPRANGGVPKAGDALSGELWEVKKERIRKASIYGKLPGWDLRSVIVKSGDDCRQEHLAVQLISHFYDIFQEAGLPLWLRPYEVLVTSSYTALIETIPDTASLHSIKSRYLNLSSLREFFAAKYQENSPSFKLAQVIQWQRGRSLLLFCLLEKFC
ncbi:phosphatidylinositol 4-kinase beta 1-like isoform X5 [Hibiscus syriacus]|uniref:phosphatidylinositol 4-kinase beta 1-like isoform X5 n=1 Tax=Hibiscus syriacus TaxID=106335 RepID=UPI00192226E1|nr:phosphatidylinositol 4-kinase beta 1-like isoform X5 [Hibiscus syriacus]